MPVPNDPFPNFVNGATADADQVDARFAPLYATLNAGVDETNMAVPKGTFKAYRGSALTLSAPPGPSLVTFNSELFDVSSWYDTSAGRYTPLVAGYFRFSWSVRAAADLPAGALLTAILAKNGVFAAYGTVSTSAVNGTPQNSVGSDVQVANGSTDYFDVRVLYSSSFGVEALAATSFFSGELVGRA